MTRAGPPVAHGGHLSGFASSVRFSKGEAFAACQALADADRALCSAGRHSEATALGALFELFEERLASGPAVAPIGSQAWSGS